jgi:hypothetical protein
MASVASQLMDEVTTHVQSDSLEDAREICADGIYFLNNPRTSILFMCCSYNKRYKSRSYSANDTLHFLLLNSAFFHA